MVSPKLNIISTPDGVDQLFRRLEAQSPGDVFVGFDTETTGVDKSDQIVGYSIAWSVDEAFYVVLAEWKTKDIKIACPDCEGAGGTGEGADAKECEVCGAAGFTWGGKTGELKQYQEMRQPSLEVIALLTQYRLVMHNSPFDCEHVLREFEIDLMPSVHTDTMELWHVLDENNYCGLKEIGYRLFGESAKKEQAEMKASVIANGGTWNEAKGPKSIKEMYKADVELLGKYGAKDTILTLQIFYEGVERLFAENLDGFFYDSESMPLMRGPTYQLNTIGLKLDLEKLKQLERDLTDECTRLKHEIHEAIAPHVKDRYPKGFGIGKGKFNLGSSQQLSWLLFLKLGNEFKVLTEGGRGLAKAMIGRVPYSAAQKRAFISAVQEQALSAKATMERANTPDQKKAAQKLISKYTPEKYLKCDKDTLTVLSKKYEWVRKLLQYKQAGKLLTTYVAGIQSRAKYGTIYPSFKQHGTTSGRYSSSNPNFQNLPREDKRIKAAIVARPGKVFVGADYSQLEPRVFASVSQDESLMGSFARGEDFYAVVGIPVFKKYECSKFKSDSNSLDKLYPHLRHNAKTLALATPYGQTAHLQASKLKDEGGNSISVNEAQGFIDAYFEAYPSVKKMQLESHEIAMRDGVVYSLYGRPRRIPQAAKIKKIYGAKATHEDLPYEARTLLNLSMNHRVQSSAASIVNRAMIAFYEKSLALNLSAVIVLQVHDEIVAECNEEESAQVAALLKECMENTVTLPGVALVAEPKIAKTLAGLK